MKGSRLYTSLVQQTTSHSILFSTPSRTTIRRRQPWISSEPRFLSTSQRWCIPQAATQEARSSATNPDDSANQSPRFGAKRRPLPEAIDGKLPSTRQDLSSLGNNPTTEEAASPWGTPVPMRRRKLTGHSAEIADLMGSTTRAAERSNSANKSSSPVSPSASIFGMPRRQPLTPTARRQEDLANVIGDTLQGGIHSRLEPPPPMRIDPFMGRGVPVSRTASPLSRALIILNGKLRESEIKRHVYRDKFHERPGLKRKRLKSERWRKRFMTGFKHAVEKVRKMKAQGW